jgi:hypothetical protein
MHITTWELVSKDSLVKPHLLEEWRPVLASIRHLVPWVQVWLIDRNGDQTQARGGIALRTVSNGRGRRRTRELVVDPAKGCPTITLDMSREPLRAMRPVDTSKPAPPLHHSWLWHWEVAGPAHLLGPSGVGMGETDSCMSVQYLGMGGGRR